MEEALLCAERAGMPVNTIGHLARPVEPVSETMLCQDVDQLFRQDLSLRCVVIRTGAGGLALLERREFENEMVGRLGYGRMLYSQRTIREILNNQMGLVL